MKQFSTLKNKIGAILLLLLLLFPIVSEAAHGFTEHNHPTCKEVTTHLHELESDCSLCDFQHTPCTYTLVELSLKAPQPWQSLISATYKNIFSSKLRFILRKRGPPALL